MKRLSSSDIKVVFMPLPARSDSYLSLIGRSNCRPKNLQCWLDRVKDWDLNRQNTLLGGCALGCAIFLGSNKLETVKLLLDAGASLDYRTFTGSTALHNMSDNEDADPDIVRLVLARLKSKYSEKDLRSILNHNKRSTTLKWKAIRFISMTLWRTGLAKSSLLKSFAIHSGSTALNDAVRRGDVEIVKILLENGADPYVETDLGMNAFEMCDRCGPFKSVMEALKSTSCSKNDKE